MIIPSPPKVVNPGKAPVTGTPGKELGVAPDPVANPVPAIENTALAPTPETAKTEPNKMVLIGIGVALLVLLGIGIWLYNK